MQTLFLIDANSLIHRAFHALPPLTNSRGEPTNALYGLASILLKIWREDRPDYAAALFDRAEPTFREEKYKEYKAQRPATPEPLVGQLREARNLFEAFGVKTLEAPGFEADDLIATLAEKFRRIPELKIIILTGDRDTLQLINNDHLVVRILQKGVSDTLTYDAAAVVARYGLRPEELIDYKALVGDASDNVKGVPGIGPKTALDLVKKFGTLENILRAAAEDPKLGARITPFKEQALQSHWLVTLDRQVPVAVQGLEELAVRADRETISDYFKRFGFNTLLKRLETPPSAAAREVKPKKDQNQGRIF